MEEVVIEYIRKLAYPKIISTIVEIHLFKLLEIHPEIESPMEKLFFIEWHYRKLNIDIKQELVPQFYDESTGEYYIDFVIFYMDNGQKIGIEIDGEWHEKSKEQVQKDKKRERFLVSRGWKIIRFAGSEIYKNPSACVEEVLTIIRSTNDK